MISMASYVSNPAAGDGRLTISNEITPDMVTELNKQKYTCEAMEETFVFKIDKE
jgi:hypothetical protein